MRIGVYGIRLHVAFLTLIPLLIMAICLGSFFLSLQFSVMDRDLLTRGQLIVRQLATSSEYGIFANNRAFLAGLTNSALREKDVKAVMILNPLGKVIEASGETRTQGDVPFSPTVQESLQESQTSDNGSELWLYQPILSTQIALEDMETASPPRQIGTAVIAMSWQRTERLKAGFLWFTVTATAAFLLITLVFVYLASRRIIRPIRDLSRAVDHIGAGDLDTRVEVSSRVSELNTLCNGINRMAMDLQQERSVLEQRIDEATQQLRSLAFYDTLTQLPNRRLLNDRLSLAMAASKRSAYYSALMFLDLDNFKPLNDLHGHDVGDLLLVQVARHLKNCVREADTVARFGGDEFVVLLNDLSTDKAESKNQARIVAEKIRATLATPFRLIIRHDGQADMEIEHLCTVSIGVTLFVDHDASRDDILKSADSAMYKAKDAGRNSIRFYGEEEDESTHTSSS